MKIKLTFLFGFFCALLQGQESRINQMESINRQRELKDGILNAAPQTIVDEEQVPEIIPGDREDMGPQYILKTKQKHRFWNILLDAQDMYTSNMLLQSGGDYAGHSKAVDTSLLVSTAEFSFAPDPFDIGGQALYPKVGFRHQWFNYALGDDGPIFRYQNGSAVDDVAGYNQFDYDAQTIFGNLLYVVDQKWVYGVGFDFTRILTHESSDSFPQISDYSETYKELVPSASVTRIFEISPVTIATTTFEQKIRYTDVDNIFPRDDVDGTNRREINNRIDSVVTLAVRHQIVPTVFASPFFRFQYSNYNFNDHRNGLNFHNREDFTYTTGASFSWEVNEWFSIGSFGSFEKRASTSPRTEDYVKFDVGGGLSANFRF